jgi:hypothetical protein
VAEAVPRAVVQPVQAAFSAFLDRHAVRRRKGLPPRKGCAFRNSTASSRLRKKAATRLLGDDALAYRPAYSGAGNLVIAPAAGITAAAQVKCGASEFPIVVIWTLSR